MKIEQKKLSNNLSVLFVDQPGSTMGSLQMWFRAGSALEEKENEGIAHFLEHMFFKGTVKRPGPMLASEIESFGGELNAFTSFDYTCYYINTPSTKMAESLDTLLDMMANPVFKNEDIVPERAVVFEEYRRSLDNPNQFAFMTLQKSCFSGGYAHPILGNEQTIKAFSEEQLHFFRDNFYNNQNALLIVAGDIAQNRKKIETLIESYRLPNGRVSEFSAFQLKKSYTKNVHSKDVRMAQLTLSLQAPELTSKEGPSEDLAISCLGYGETSRLHRNIVLDNSTANASSSSTMFMNKKGLHFIRLNFPFENLELVLKKLEKTFNDLLKDGFDKWEVEKIKNQYLASKIYDKESLESYAFSLGHGFAQSGNIHSESEFIEKIRTVSLRAVNRSFQEMLSRPLHASLQIPKEASIKHAKKVLSDFSDKIKKVQTESKASQYANVVKSKYDQNTKLLKLKNGISLLYRKNDMTPTFVMHAYLKGGLSEESLKTGGSFHLISSLLTKGHHKIPYDKIKTFLEDRSASLGGFSGKNAYGLTLHGQSSDFEDLLSHFMGALLSSDMPTRFFNHEKKLTLRHLENQKEEPVKICFQEFTQLLFNGHPYSQNSLGTEKSLKNLKRADLSSLHKHCLAKNELLITYCGDLDLEEVIDLLVPHTKTLKPRPTKSTLKKFQPILNKEKHIHFDREQTHIFTGLVGAKMGDKENQYLKILTTHLSGQSSELFVEVRDKQGLCYTTQPVHFNALEGGYWGIYIASGHDKVEPALKAIRGIINKHKEHGLSKEQFETCKRMIEGQNLVNIQTNEDYANVYSVPALHGRGIDFFHIKNKQIEKMTHEEFNKGIKKILSRQWNTVIVGRKN